ncbi:sulfotransferase family protein [Rhodothermus profundi]|uniref:Sulfotransferase domain-containing protein n=1 Tax=Rhodothermus profundi TaxID=633813 RepID=A0A1M6XL26_9BACT|nr:sulfotransferase [Rhodothermus profundi]SHL06505.1 Sulfotransferase domain-containing protein [Rhodothermus profundi]
MEEQQGRLPDFLIIGAQKSATTWLARLLRQHPGVYMPERELHFFNYPGSLAQYQAAFRAARPDQLIGEKTPDYLHLTERQIARIKEWMPSVRLIVVLRDPVARSWSQARMEVAAVNRRPLAWRDRFWLAWHVHLLRNRLRSDYRRALQRWQQFFPRQQFLVLFYEDLYRDPVSFMHRVFDFLGLSALPAQTLHALAKRRVWESPAADMPAWLRYALTRRYCAQTQWLKQQGYQVPASWPNASLVQQLRREERGLSLKAGVLTGMLTVLSLPEHLLVYMGRWFPALRLYRLYDRLQHWRMHREEHERPSTR